MAGAKSALRWMSALALALGLAGLAGFGGAAAAAPSLRDALFGGRIDAGRREEPPVVGCYAIDGGETFVLDRTSTRPLLRFAGTPEVWVLDPIIGPRGDIIYKNDLGLQMLRASKVGGLTVFTSARPAGSAAALSGPCPPLQLAPMSPSAVLQRLAQASLRASRAAQKLLPMEAEVTPASAALTADAAIVTAEAIVRLSTRPEGRQVLARIGKIVFDEGPAPAVLLRPGALVIIVAPDQGVAGRPSSDRIIAALTQRTRAVGNAPGRPPRGPGAAQRSRGPGQR